MNDLLISINLPTLFLFIITLLAIGACFFLAGYILGSRSYHGVFYNATSVSNKLHPKNHTSTLTTNINIDDKKIVTKIKTDHLEKKYDSLGDKKESAENITDAINKLKNIKR